MRSSPVCENLLKGWSPGVNLASSGKVMTLYQLHSHLTVPDLEGQCTSLCVCEHHLQAFVEFCALEEGFKVAQGSQITILEAASMMLMGALSRTFARGAALRKSVEAFTMLISCKRGYPSSRIAL